MDSPEKTDPNRRSRDPLARLASWLTWQLGHCHWETCRVRFNPGFTRVYAARALVRGYSRASIAAAYEAALREEHTVACDVGASIWRPFRIMRLALQKLARVAPDWQPESSDKVRPQQNDRRQWTDLSAALAVFCDSVAADPYEDYVTHERLAA